MELKRIIKYVQSVIRHMKYLLIIFLIFFAFAACHKKSTDEIPLLTIVSKHPLDIPETSDLSSYKNPGEFLTVSDTNDRIYVISAVGKIIKILNYNGDNLEGVYYMALDSTIYVVEEKKKEIVKLDTTGNEILRFSLELNNADSKHGPEGITYNPANNHLYVVTEKNPSLLIELKLDGTIVSTHDLSFASDYSAIFYDSYDNSLWILSDESELLVKCDLSGNPISSYRTGVKKGEGVVVDQPHSKVYIVTDNVSVLYWLSF